MKEKKGEKDKKEIHLYRKNRKRQKQIDIK
jgi:hypothetical protein